MSTQAQMIQAESTGYISYKHYSEFDFYQLIYGNKGDDGFIHRDGLTFEDYIGCLYLTGNELLYYPELAKYLREVKEYPTLKRTYSVNRNVKGMAFIEYFYKRVRETFNAFQTELAAASSIVNNLIHLHGQVRQTPIIDRLIENAHLAPRFRHDKLVINGVTWQLADAYGSGKVTECINFRSLLGIANDFKRLYIEDAVLGTPFIALRIGKTGAHKGHVQWYNLETRQKVSKAETKK